MSFAGQKQPDEIQLWIGKSLNGDRSSQYAIYKQYSKAMYNISHRITGNEEDARDVLQEAFVNAFRNLGSYRGESSFGAWLKKIVVNQAISHIRKQKPLYKPLEDLPDTPVDDAGWEDHDNPVMDPGRIRNAIRELPDGFRTVFSLYLLEGYDHAEIGQILGISESTSKSQYLRAKKRLKEILKING
ncbi:MAG TPA: sigma-70 family RNA polymerase sigma factor [Cyclobacteriaceae bacterium]|nr:sigma-70 family RNA polymerase sigma factor [Cyclobacteriaceae bacterium]